MSPDGLSAKEASVKEPAMSPVAHQTIKLSRGRHSSPREGACVMELASMLAGEPFSDHPAAVCPVIGACLRAYNDWTDDEHRRDLYPYAAKVVGTCSSGEVEHARSERVIAWTHDVTRRRRRRFPFAPRLRALVLWPQPDDLGSRVLHAAARCGRRSHPEVLALIDELIAIGGPADQAARAEDARVLVVHAAS
jgi:hypothetical protein